MNAPSFTISPPAICCVGYNRPASMRRLLNSIKRGFYNRNDIPLIISIDESPLSNEVEAVAKEFEWEHGLKIIRRFPKRLGLRNHSLLCGDLAIEYGGVIFLEDDVVIAPGFYEYILQAIGYYRSDLRIFGIALYNQKWISEIGCEFTPAYNGSDVYFLKRDISRGQCWLREQWIEFREWFKKMENHLPSENREIPRTILEWPEKSSWSKYVSFYLIERDLYYAVPYFSLSTNMSELGEHTDIQSDICQVALSENGAKQYQFCLFEKGVAYDSFFERTDPFLKEIVGIPFEEICMDLNGMKYDFGKYHYVLTSKKLGYNYLAEYGVNMDPIENNIIYNIHGKDVILYAIPLYTRTSSRTCISDDRLMHVLARYPTKSLLRILSRKIQQRILYQIKKRPKLRRNNK